MEIYELPDKELKLIVSRKINELQDKRERQLNELRNTIHEQNEKIWKETDIFKKNQTNSAGEEYNQWNEKCN